MVGRIINSNGGFYQVETQDGKVVFLKPRGKFRSFKTTQINPKAISQKAEKMTVKFSPKVGDLVLVEDEMIAEILPRKNELIRPDVANVDQILLIFAAKEPDFSFYLLDLFLVNILKNNIQPLIVITKIDKLAAAELLELQKNLSYYEDLGYKVVYVNSCSGEGVDKVKELLSAKLTVLSGQTGAGKSTLINAIIPDFKLKTQEISQALGRGKHTTRQTTLYKYDSGYIGDTPGFSKLDLSDLKKTELSLYFSDFAFYKCQFRDCLHQSNTKGCGVYEAYKKGLILPSRYENYVRMLLEIISKEK